MTNEDIDVMVKLRELLLSLDKEAVYRILEFMKSWNKNRPAPEV